MSIDCGSSSLICVELLKEKPLNCVGRSSQECCVLYRVTTFLEFLEMSWNSTKVREKAQSQGKVRN